MRIELLTSPGCRNTAAARQTVTGCLITLGIDVPIIDHVGRYPSPTVLVDGIDVMRPATATAIGDACRLDVPTPRQVFDALRAQLPPAIRELHRGVLRGFRDHGQAHRDDLHPTAAALRAGLDDAMHQLASADLVHCAPDGQIEIAYPFSGRATGHTVHLTGHPPVAAMCAIDALGIPLMTGTDGVIDSTDPGTGAPIRVQRRGDEWTWQPATAVVVMGHTDCCSTLANTVCRSITFHADPQLAQFHLDHRPGLQGFIIGQDDAIAFAQGAFGHLLTS